MFTKQSIDDDDDDDDNYNEDDDDDRGKFYPFKKVDFHSSNRYSTNQND
jgi:hypothetical protein